MGFFELILALFFLVIGIYTVSTLYIVKILRRLEHRVKMLEDAVD